MKTESSSQLIVSFGKVLKETRQSKNITQEGLALSVGLDRTFISMLERGLRQPTLTTLFLIAQGLDVELLELIKAVERDYLQSSGLESLKK